MLYLTGKKYLIKDHCLDSLLATINHYINRAGYHLLLTKDDFIEDFELQEVSDD